MMPWELIVALAIAIPIILIPVALVWYINFRGTYEIIRDARQQRNRRAELLREAEAILRGEVTTITTPVEDVTDFWENKSPCWEMSRCPPEIRDECPAYRNRALPCWAIEDTYSKLCMAGGQANGQDTTNCHTCSVYKKYGEGKPIELRPVVGSGTGGH